MSKCSKCGADIKEGSSFCSKCGNKAEVISQTKQKQPQSQTQTQTKTQTQTSSTTSSIAPTQTETPKKKKSTGVKILLGCLIAFLVFAIVGLVLGYFLVKKGVDIAQDEIKKAEEEWSDEIEGLKELEEMSEEIKENAEDLKDEAESSLNNIPSTETKSTKPTKKASKVVEEFMACTLGTIPQQCPSTDKDSVAKEHLTLEMRTDYNSAGFVPLNYCIQDGPSDVRIDSETEAGGFAYVLVSAKYGTDNFNPFWNFVLVVQDGEWKIKEIQCLNF